jgi:hypothetical protein
VTLSPQLRNADFSERHLLHRDEDSRHIVRTIPSAG